MAPQFEGSRRIRYSVLIIMAAMLCMCLPLAAQDQPVPKVDLFTGYQWLNPGGSIPRPNQNPFQPIPFKLPDIPQGAGLAFTYNFDSHWGLEFDYGANFNKYAVISTVSGGPRFMWRTDGANFFAHTLLGYNRLTSRGLDPNNGLGAILGGGIDLPLWHFLTIRLFEADFVLSRHNFADKVGPQFPELRRQTFEGARLRTGLLWNFGYPPGVPPSATCSVQPTEVMVGEPVTATVNASNFNPKHTLNYSWSSTGGKVTGKDNTGQIDTNGVAGGSYTVTAHVMDPKMKKNGEASCTANFTVKEPPKNPPTMSCTANPASLQAGGTTTSTITCDCKSPDNVSVNVSGWTASSGTVNGTGNTATLDVSNAQPGSVTVNATCTDARGLNTSSSAQVNVEAPPPPPPPPAQASKLSSCDFPNSAKPWRVDNTCKAVLDDVAQRLQHEPDAKLVIVGNADPKERRRNLAAERAVDAKAYLSGGEAKQGIDASRIETRTGSGGSKTADFWIVPAGASFTEAGATPVDENKVKPIPDHPARRGGRAAKKPQ